MAPFSDARLAVRGLTHAPLFTAVAVISIALGIGATTAVFSLLDQVTLRPLPVARPTELVQLSAKDTESYGGGIGNGTELSWPMFTYLRDHPGGVTDLFGRLWFSFHVGHDGRTERVAGELVSGTYFPALGLSPAAGRLLTADDDRFPGGHPVAVLGHDYWQRRFGGRPDIVGQSVTVNGHRLTVVGVAPAGFFGLEMATPAALFVPLTMQPQMGPSFLRLENRRFRWVQVYGRLAAGTTLDAARARLQPTYAALLAEEAKDAAFSGASSETRTRFLAGRLDVLRAPQGQAFLRESLSRPLRLLMAVAAGVLLIACANVANLLVARGVSRQRELALRVALGASRTRVTTMLLVEAAVLALAGSVAGVTLASWGVSLLVGLFADGDVATPVTTSPDARILAFTAGVTALVTLASGLVPAWRAAPASLAPSLKAAGGGVVREQPHLRRALVVVQVGLSFLMLAGAGLFVRSLENVRRAPSGLAVDHVASFTVSPGAAGYDAVRSRLLMETLLGKLSAVPGVRSAGLASIGILEGGGWSMDFTIDGFRPAPGDAPTPWVNLVTPTFFEVLKIPVRAGRGLDGRDARLPAADERGWPYRHAVVNETFVARYLEGLPPLGRHIGIGAEPGTAMPIEIVGVVGDTRYTGLREESRPQVFLAAFEANGIGDATVYVRTAGDPEALGTAIRREVAALDPGLAVFNVASLEERVSRSLRNERLLAGLSTAFAALATLLAMVGLYGVMAHAVSKRTREIGIRMALGAKASVVAGRVAHEAGMLVLGGLVLAAPAAWWLGRYVESQLYAIQPADPSTLALAAAGLLVVGLVAAAVPARRAARIDPMRALRDE